MTRLDNDLISRKDLLEALEEYQSKISALNPANDYLDDVYDLITNAPTVEAEIFPSKGLEKALENYKQPTPLPVCKLTHEQLNTPYGVEPIKPTIEADSGEAVAWALFYENGVVNHVTKSVHPTMNGSHLKYKPLYTSPPKREWKSLSDEVIEELYDKHFDDIQTLLYEYQNKLKEVNGYD